MASLSIFDMVVIGLTLFLGLKGIFRGFIKEVFGIIGIVGGIAVAFRVSPDVGNIIAPLLGLEKESIIHFLGFLLSLIVFWAIAYLLGMILSKIFSASGLGIFDRILGFIFGAAKIFLIFAVLAHILYQIDAFKKTIDEKAKDSIVMPYLLKTGASIAKIDTTKINSVIKNTTDDVMNKGEKNIKNAPKEELNTNKPVEKVNTDENTVGKTVEKLKEEVVNKAVDAVKEKLQN